MTHTHQNNSSTSINHPALDLGALRPELQDLAKATVDKTLHQARETRTDPVLGSSSALATFYMMMPRNDGKALEQILDIVARHADSLTVIRNGLKFGIDPTHLGLVQSNSLAILAQIQSDHDPEPRGPTYRADGLVINQTTGKSCLLEFKRQASTIETTRLNQIADNLTIARAQVPDLLYRKHKRTKIEPEAVSWAIIDCSDQELPQRFINTGVLGLDSLDAICGIKNVAEAYRLARVLMAAEFRRGERELVVETQNFIPLDRAEAMIDAAVTAERREMTDRGRKSLLAFPLPRQLWRVVMSTLSKRLRVTLKIRMIQHSSPYGSRMEIICAMQMMKAIPIISRRSCRFHQTAGRSGGAMECSVASPF